MTAAGDRPAVPSTVPWGTIAAVCGCAGIFSLTLGLTYPLMAVILESRGASATLIGLNAAMSPLGIVLSAFHVSTLARRIGAWPLTVGCILATIVLVLALGLWPILPAWFALRFVLGMVINGLFVASETWINQLASNRTRGRVMGFYATVISLGFGLGPLVVRWSGAEGLRPFVTGSLCLVPCLAVMLACRRTLPEFAGRDTVPLRRFIPLAPTLVLAVGLFALFDAAAMALLPVYLIKKGLAADAAMIALSVAVAGNIVLQVPIGWLGDLLPRRAIMRGCAVLAAAGSLALPAMVARPEWLLAMLFVWGGVAFGIYTMALAELGERFQGGLLVAGNAAFALMWGVGGIVGPPLMGWAMSAAGPDGLAWSLVAAFSVFVLACRRRAALRR